MIRILIFFLLYFFIPISGLAQSSTTISIGILKNSAVFANEKDIKFVIELWLNKFLPKSKYEINVIEYEKVVSLLEDFKLNKLTLIGLNAFNYLENEKSLVSLYSKIFTFQRYDSKYLQYLLISHKDINTKNVEKLPIRLSLKKDDKSTLLWLDYMYLNRDLKEYFDFIEVHEKKNHSSAVHATYFNQSEFAVVPLTIYELLLELNPAIKKNLKVVKFSQRIFTSSIWLMNKNISTDVSNDILNSISEINSTKEGSTILNILRMNKIVVEQPSYLDPIKSFYLEYKKKREENEK